MLTQFELKYYSGLLQKKLRKKENKFLVEGKRLVEEALKSDFECELIIINEIFLKRNNFTFKKNGKDLRTEIVSDKKFLKLCDTKSPQGIAAVLKIPDLPKQIKKDQRVIVALENISDPGNIGTIIRICDWFGIENVLVSGGSVDLYNSKVVRSTMGSIFHVNIIESNNFYSDLEEYKNDGFAIWCSDMEGENVFSQTISGKTILILSNEAHGPTDEIIRLSDKNITIPKYGKAESLNVASASAVMIAQLVR